MNLGNEVTVSKSKGFETIENVVREELKTVGFGILTEIDVKATMKTKIDVDYKPYKILGACNPKIANQALQIDFEIGLLLPCNVIIYEKGDNITVSLINPMTMFSLIERDDVKPIVESVEKLLSEALEKIKSRLM